VAAGQVAPRRPPIDEQDGEFVVDGRAQALGKALGRFDKGMFQRPDSKEVPPAAPGELWPLLAAALWLHLGKGTTLGLGQLQVLPAAD
jgi:hypothetical protein